MKMVSLVCVVCDKAFEKQKKEFVRQVKNGRNEKDFCCGPKCGSIFANKDNKLPIIKIKKNCEFCKKEFTQKVKQGHEGRKFCKSSCASSGSVTEKRRAMAKISGKRNSAITMHSIMGVEIRAKGLRKREAWKYKKIQAALNKKGVNFISEYPLIGTKYIFDLALVDSKIFIEFDSKYHKNKRQLPVDEDKEKMAKEHGWAVIRKSMQSGKAVDVNLIKEFI